jgi:mRNA-degrading endonuclease YafQ of YafQ-DinJ toxin-antitoxin module
MYRFNLLPTYQKSYKKFVQNNSILRKRLEKALHILQNNPLHPSLRSHKVDAKEKNDVWSSWVTGDVRIIWEYAGDKIHVIYLIDVGSHSGSRKVYK